MLIFGYLQEIGLINILLSTGFGFLFFWTYVLQNL